MLLFQNRREATVLIIIIICLPPLILTPFILGVVLPTIHIFSQDKQPVQEMQEILLMQNREKSINNKQETNPPTVANFENVPRKIYIKTHRKVSRLPALRNQVHEHRDITDKITTAILPQIPYKREDYLKECVNEYTLEPNACAYFKGGFCRAKRSPWSFSHVKLLCKPQSDGWLVWFRRIDATTSFRRTWKVYSMGFGTPNGNYWLGLKTLHHLTTQKWKATLRYEIKTTTGGKAWGQCAQFIVGSEDRGFPVLCTQRTGNFSDNKKHFSSVRFTTKDRDHDNYMLNCAKKWAYGGGWWYTNCGEVFLTGKYPDGANDSGNPTMLWKHALSFNTWDPIAWVEMKIRFQKPHQ